MTTAVASGAKRIHSNQVGQAGRLPVVDVFRGLAAVLMVINRVGVSFYGDNPAQGTDIWSILIHLGSYAPVLFFTCTGIGYGLANPARRVAWRDTFLKIALLLAADNLLVQQGGGVLGLDFFGFTAVAMLFLTLLRKIRRPVVVAMMLIIVLFMIRFAVGPWLSPRVEPGTLLQWIMGFSQVSGMSYPLSPWLIYPLIGFGLARISTDATLRPRHVAPGAVMLVLGVSALATAWLAWRGATYHRWGTVSLLYFLSSLLVLALGNAASATATRSGSHVGRFQLDGMASFLVVPAHYALISLLYDRGLPRLHEGWKFLMLALVVVVLALTLSASVSKVISQYASTLRVGHGLMLAVLVLTVSIVLAQATQFVPRSLLSIWFLPAMVCIAMALQLRLTRRNAA
jgi:hypothetical protein